MHRKIHTMYVCMYVCMYVSPQRMHGIPLPFHIHQWYKYDSQLTCDGCCQCTGHLAIQMPWVLFHQEHSFFLFFWFLFSFLLYSPFSHIPPFFLIIFFIFSFSLFFPFPFFFHGKLLIGGTIPSTMSNIASSRERLSRALLLPAGIKHWWICSSLL